MTSLVNHQQRLNGSKLRLISMKKPVYLFSTSSHPDAISINSLDIQLLKPTINFSKYDYLILTSKQAVLALKQYDKSDYINKKALCISQQTAKSYEKIGGKVLELGSGYGDTLSYTIKKYPQTTKWLYLRAKIVASNFVHESKEEGIDIDEIIVYESVCSQAILNAPIKNGSILIFTSPSSIKCYMKSHTFTSEDEVIVIGKTTANALPKDVLYHISYEPTIESCFELLN